METEIFKVMFFFIQTALAGGKYNNTKTHKIYIAFQAVSKVTV